MTEPAPAPKKRRNWILIGIAGIVGLCVLCVVVVMIFNATPAGQEAMAETRATGTANAIAQATEQTAAAATEAARPTDTPAPTEPPAPTDVPEATETPEPPPTPEQMSGIGEQVQAGGIALTVNGVSTASVINDFMTPQTDGNIFLVIDVTVENLDRDDETPYNPLYFSARDADGFTYQPSFVAPAPDFGTGNLPTGDRARGNVAFEVSPTAKEVVITYEPLVILGGFDPLRVMVGDVPQ